MKDVQIGRIHDILGDEVKNYKVPIVDLIKIQTDDPFKVLVTTIMSARTQDGATAQAAKRLFSKVDRPSDLRKFTERQIEEIIFPVGFYKNKARFLKELPDVLDKEFNGEVPKTIDELIKLPGVGRKTANLVVTIAFDDYGICVDTHVHRIMNRFGYVKTKTPYETEMALREKLPKRYWKTINSILVAFGQNLCRPISPKCSECPVESYCNRVGVEKWT
ncbi:endonuclease III [Candidatus Woesearchaeota archaeon CG11_big_fil_rev_8_21_14_0_20_43_8]|nr:MAG: endonuclease III [Candidatus Woesearchaeota archaeon CG11_big_fil_rev_8_21_14_0_20_43_8]PIO05480.1 MAG: endonuclease III [Candidatus Woesearchaeota archaeon CG08_land_8_20_14_0_20_43_7]